MRMLVKLLLLVGFSLVIGTWGVHHIKAPSIFRSDEVELHKFSAVLAATHPFHKMCSDQISKAIGPIRRLVFLMKGKPLMEQAGSIRLKQRAVHEALSRYESRVDNVLKSYHMPLETFNEMAEEINQSGLLKRKVALQSYCYKIAADLEANLQKAIPQLPSLSFSSPAGTRSTEVLDRRVGDQDGGEGSAGPSSMHRLARTLVEIEQRRLALRNNLMTTLRVRELPANICDPDLQSSFAPPIRRACAEFPLIAEKVMSRNGLGLEEFTELQHKLDHNLLFRFKVQQEIKKLKSY